MKATQAVIIVLLVANLSATIWFGSNNRPEQIAVQQDETVLHKLPESITPQVRQELMDRYKEAYNNEDADALYDMFGPVVKAQLSREEAAAKFESIFNMFGSIEGGAYVHSELESTQGDTKVFTLFYTVGLSDTQEFGNKGTLKVTVATQGSEYQIYRFVLHAGPGA